VTRSTPVKAPPEPIGLIKVICLDHEKNKPVYDLLQEEGPPHQRTFTMGCSVVDLNLETSGTGSSKQEAKKEAAMKMYHKLIKKGFLPLDGNRSSGNDLVC